MRGTVWAGTLNARSTYQQADEASAAIQGTALQNCPLTGDVCEVDNGAQFGGLERIVNSIL